MASRSPPRRRLTLWLLARGLGCVLAVRELGQGQTSAYIEREPRVDAHASLAATVTIKAYWVRHAWSCANLMKKAGEAKLPKYKALCDPFLSDVGIERSKELGKLIRREIKGRINDATEWQNLRVFSSWAIRAIETALYAFPDSKVRPIPHIAEQDNSMANRPLKVGPKMKKLGIHHGALSAGRLDFHSHNDCGEAREACDKLATGLEDKSNYNEFLKYFPGVLRKTFGSSPPSSEVPVVIVSHSKYIKSSLQCATRPENNEVFVQTYTLDWDRAGAQLEPRGCEALFPREQEVFPLPPTLLCDEDVKRCGTSVGQCGAEGEEEEDAAELLRLVTDKESPLAPAAWLAESAGECQKFRDAHDGSASVLLRDRSDALKYTEMLEEEKSE